MIEDDTAWKVYAIEIVASQMISEFIAWLYTYFYRRFRASKATRLSALVRLTPRSLTVYFPRIRSHEFLCLRLVISHLFSAFRCRQIEYHVLNLIGVSLLYSLLGRQNYSRYGETQISAPMILKLKNISWHFDGLFLPCCLGCSLSRAFS